MVLDAACSVEDGESRMLVVSPAPPQVPLYLGSGVPKVGAIVEIGSGYPSPIEQPLQLGAELDSNVTVDYTDGLSNGLAITSIDALRWMQSKR